MSADVAHARSAVSLLKKEFAAVARRKLMNAFAKNNHS
jgi:hypothetical protein